MTKTMQFLPGKATHNKDAEWFAARSPPSAGMPHSGDTLPARTHFALETHMDRTYSTRPPSSPTTLPLLSSMPTTGGHRYKDRARVTPPTHLHAAYLLRRRTKIYVANMNSMENHKNPIAMRALTDAIHLHFYQAQSVMLHVLQVLAQTNITISRRGTSGSTFQRDTTQDRNSQSDELLSN